MSVLSDAAEEQVDSSCLHDGFLVVLALCLEVRSVSVQDMDVLLRLVDVVEKIFVHEGVVALRMLYRESHIFVHVERNHVLEGNFAGLHHSDEFLVSLDRGGTGAETDNERFVADSRLLVDLAGDVVRSPYGCTLAVVSDNDFHVY